MKSVSVSLFGSSTCQTRIRGVELYITTFSLSVSLQSTRIIGDERCS